jgi:hypothetical protein
MTSRCNPSLRYRGKIIAMRRAADAFPDLKIQAFYLHIADLIEQYVREYDRAMD